MKENMEHFYSIMIMKEYFYKYEKGENEELYNGLFTKKIDDYKRIINKKNKIIKEIEKLISKNSLINKDELKNILNDN